MLPRLRAGTPDLPGLLAFSPPSARQVCAVPGRTTLRLSQMRRGREQQFPETRTQAVNHLA